MTPDLPVDWVFAALLLSLRIAPALAFAPPFTLTRIPAATRALLGLGAAACMAASAPAERVAIALSPGPLAAGALSELAVGLAIALALHLMFAALETAGRVLDIQAGFGLAGVIDPVSWVQNPLLGTLMAYAAALAFFQLDGHAALLRIVSASLDAMPLGAGRLPTSLAPLLSLVSGVFLIAFGVAGAAILALFLTDLAIAFLARTVPQMNVLVLGLQVKTIVVLVALPLALGASGALLVRLATFTLESLPALL